MKRKILHVLNSRAYSGAENVVLSIIRNLEEYDFAYVARDGEIRERLDSQGIKYYLPDKLSVKKIRSIIADFKPDLIHAHDFTASILVAFSGTKVPIISHLHSNPIWIKKYGFKSIIYYISTRRFYKILAVSKPVFQEYVFGKRLENKSEVVFNPINLEEIRKMAKARCDDEEYDIVTIGRLCAEKNPKLFIDIVEECVRNNSAIKAAMLGNGELYEEVKKYIFQKHMEEHIDVLGFKDNPYSYLKQSKILCIPSAWEGFGMVAVEALALGKPVVAAAVGGLPYIVNDLCGKICTNRSEYVEEIMKLLSNNKYYEQKSSAAVERAEMMAREIDYYDNLKQIYSEVM